jgi:hypothetical protein
MISEAIKLERLRARNLRKERDREALTKVLTHPATIAVATCIAVELLQRVSIGQTPAQPAGFSWGVDIGFHPAKPAADVRLISDVLGSAIEVGAIINLAGGLDTITTALKTGLALPAVAGLLKGVA